MTHKEENIVNIAMMAATLLKDGRIRYNEMTGHMGMTDDIISLADRFEREHANVDFDTDGLDYWEEIDNFAEKELTKLHGIERETPTQDVHRIWARVGMTLDVSPKTFSRLRNGDKEALTSVLKGNLDSSYLDGETYFPAIDQNKGLEEISFDLYEPQKPKLQLVYNGQLTVDKEAAELIKEMFQLTGREIRDKYALTDSASVCYTIPFHNGYEMDVDVVIPKDDKKPYIDTILFDRQGREVTRSVADHFSFDEPFRVELDENTVFLGEIEVEEPNLEKPEAVVYMESGGGTRRELLSGTYEECLAFCHANHWVFKDENEFVWDLDLEDNREYDRGDDVKSLDSMIQDADKKQAVQEHHPLEKTSKDDPEL